MTEEDFLARWSRRKREVAKAEAEPRIEAKPLVTEAKPDAVQEVEPEFDPASLPPIESINALTDITAFLRAGVPAELTRAALRRVWTADPAIRDFIGLSENAWDFTDPAAMPGFGPLESTEEIRRMVAHIVDQIGHAGDELIAETEAKSASDADILKQQADAHTETENATQSKAQPKNPPEYSDREVLVQSNKVDTAPQQDVGETPADRDQTSRRSHGGALPS